MSHIFISYSKHNKEYARKLADHLLSQGFDVWIDDQIDYGDDWWRTIVRAIRGAKAFVVIMSPESDESDWVQREVTLADKSKIPAFPLWLSGDVDASENWAIYVRTQYLDVRGEKLPGGDFTLRLEKVAPRKGGEGKNITETLSSQAAFDGWIPKMDEAAPPPMADEETDKAVEQFRRNIAAIEKLKQTPVLPDVSSILPPPFEWCEIPAGKVTIEYSETDHKTFDVPQFWMAKYPITNAQYQVFVDAEDGYRDPAWWGYSDEAKLWLRDHTQPRAKAFDGHDLPRTNVTWYEAVAFCQWLTAKINPLPTSSEFGGGVLITLPTEQQWQRAAQGDDTRKYPWGNTFDKARCNTREIKIGKTTPVTQYSGGTSPFDVMDMSGNAWEWCLTRWGATNQQIVMKGNESRVLRGGSFDYDQYSAYSVCRRNYLPGGRSHDVGFRVICMPIIE